MRRLHAFTLIELLVVISIIALLIAVLLPALGSARYASKVSVCRSNYHQMGVAVNSFAVEHKGYFPDHNFQLNIGLNAWGASRTMPLDLNEYGAAPPVWFCPLFDKHPHTPFDRENLPGQVFTSNDAQWVTDQLQYNGLQLTLLPFYYWAPRETTVGSYTPHNGVGGTRDITAFDHWPRSIDEPGTEGHPLMSDILFTPPSAIYDQNGIQGGHVRGGKSDSVTAVWVDGSVEVIPRSDFELRQDAHWGNWY
ncbi:type II secretion system protein [Phycisphaeraceae bacterium D3-23]